MEKITFFFTKFQIKGFSLRIQTLIPHHSLPNMSGRFYARNEADWTAGKKGPRPFSLIRRMEENKSVWQGENTPVSSEHESRLANN